MAWRSLCRFDQNVGDLLIEFLRHRSHTFVAILTKECGREVVFESCSASPVFVEDDPERCIKSCCQFVPCHLRRDKHIADHILDGVAPPGKDLQPVSVRGDREDNKTGVTLDFLQFGFDTRDLPIVQKGTNSTSNLGSFSSAARTSP
jgi:hypothetical protein